MKDVDRTKVYNSQKPAAPTPSNDPSSDDKELLVLQARLEKANGEDRRRIQQMIREILKKQEREGQQPHVPFKNE